jgi:ABC-type uncharacterized transport system permease subunit
MNPVLLYVACAFYAVALAASVRGFAKPRRWTGVVNLTAIFLGFVFTSWYLAERGRVEGSCPLNSLYDVLIFQSWSLVLIYLAVGPAYRLSLLGAFTAPLALGFLLLSVLLPISREPVARQAVNGWIEAHAALSVIAYGCFGLACIAGAMYLIQERQLKARRFSSLMHGLPPISDLAVANRRLVLFGFCLLTSGFLAGFFSGMPVNTTKFWGSLSLWAVYGVLLVWYRLWPFPAKRLAYASILVFGAAMVTLPAVQYLSSRP